MCSEVLFLCKSTLHVSGGTHAHHQEYNLNCINIRARLRWEEVTETIWDRLWIVPTAVDTAKIVLLMMGVCAARNM